MISYKLLIFIFNKSITTLYFGLVFAVIRFMLIFENKNKQENLMFKRFNWLSTNRILIFWIICLSLIYALLFSRENYNNSNEALHTTIQYNVYNSYNTIEKTGERFVYFKDSLIWWTSNDIPLPKKISKQFPLSNLITLDNGFYIVKAKKESKLTTLYISLMKKNYPINNTYLVNSFNPQYNLKNKENIIIQRSPTIYPIKIKNKTVCYINFSHYTYTDSSPRAYIMGFIYLFVIYLMALFIGRLVMRKSRLAYNIKLCILVLCFIAFYFISSSIGNLVILQILLLVLVRYFRLHVGRKWEDLYILLLTLCSTGIYFVFLSFLLKSFTKGDIISSLLNFNISFVMFICQLLLASYTLYLALERSLITVKHRKNKFSLILSPLVFCVVFFICWLLLSQSLLYSTIISIVFVLLLLLIIYHPYNNYKFSILLYSLVLLFLFSLINGLIIYNYSYNIKKQGTALLIKNIASQRDINTEKNLLVIQKYILNDKWLQHYTPNLSYQQISNYILNSYLKEIGKKYDISILFAYPQEKIYINSENTTTNALVYINSRIKKDSPLLGSKSIFKDPNLLEQKAYACVFYFGTGKKQRVLFIDLAEKKSSNEMGYPDLLINKNENEILTTKRLENYGAYQNRHLAFQKGNYYYPATITFNTNGWLHYNKYSHYIFSSDKGKTIWIASLKEASLWDRLSLPSYLFILSSLIFLILSILLRPKRFFSFKQLSIRNSIQTIVIIVFLISLLLSIIISIRYFYLLNRSSNRASLVEKTQAISYETNMFFSSTDYGKEDLSYFLSSLSNTFLTDINVYNSKGILLASSRDKIFSLGIISPYMNNNAFYTFRKHSTPLLLMEESIGERKYIATYMPIIVKKSIVGYLHIPYIIQQKNMEGKIQDFMSTFINIYVVWLTVALIITIFLSNIITKPLQNLQTMLRRLSLGKQNEKIKWNRRDEFGDLIYSYNTMVDKLENATSELLNKERQEAWREMARQVAHDIKNPLTPMKLTLQQLQRLQEDDIVAFTTRFQEISPALIEQINTISYIASEFSSMAKGEEMKSQWTDINDCLLYVVNIFKANKECLITYINNTKTPQMVPGDKYGYTRILNNLIKNAIQAMSGKTGGHIIITLSAIKQNCCITIHDNGCGIDKENKAKIFSTHFTTKQSGSGLGLSITKSIIEQFGGTITFSSTKNKGTTFLITLPLKQSNNSSISKKENSVS